MKTFDVTTTSKSDRKSVNASTKGNLFFEYSRST